MKLLHILFHVIVYYIAWFACILLAARNDAWLGFIVVLFLLLLQWLWQIRYDRTKRLCTFIIMLTLIGFVVDSILAQANLIQFKANPWSLNLSPPWMIAIWINFSMVFYACLQKIYYRYILLAILAFLGFPLAYAAGVKLGAANFPYGYFSAVIFGFVWGVLFPLYTYLFQKYIYRI